MRQKGRPTNNPAAEVIGYFLNMLTSMMVENYVVDMAAWGKTTAKCISSFSVWEHVNSMKTESLLEMFSIGFAWKSLFTKGVDCQTWWQLQSPQRVTRQSVWYESTMPWVQKWAPVCGVLTQRQSGLSGLQVRPPVLYRPEIGTTHWAVMRQKDRQLFRFHEE